MATTGRLPKAGVEKALAALRRFRVLREIMGVPVLHVIATAAARDASNGAEFLAAAGEAIGAPVTLLSGGREAELSALGSFPASTRPDGVVGDLGGGSLELTDVKGTHAGKGTSLPLGGLTLMDASRRSPRAAVKIVREALAGSRIAERLSGRTFYAVGGTWRALAKLHMSQRNYPLAVTHGYVIPTRDAADFAGLVERANTETLISIDAVNAARRPFLAYGAVVLEEIIRRARPREVMISATGVREGLLYEMLDVEQRRQDPVAGRGGRNSTSSSRARPAMPGSSALGPTVLLNPCMPRKPRKNAGFAMPPASWPMSTGAHTRTAANEESVNIVENAAFLGVDHPGRCFLALAASYRYLGLEADVSPQIRALVSARMLDRARILAAATRAAFVISGAMPGVLPLTPLACVKTKLILTLPRGLADLASERLQNRLKQLGRLIGREPAFTIAN